MTQRTMLLCGIVCLFAMRLSAQEPAGDAGESTGFQHRLERAIEGTTQKQSFDLAYKFTAGEVHRWQVEHVETLKTSMNEYSEVVSSRTVSHSYWEVVSVDSQGQATLVQTIPWVQWWQRNGEQEPIEFDTRKGGEPPPQFATQAQKVNLPFPAMSVQRQGKITKNQDKPDQYDFGAGSFWIPLPDQPVAVGHSWTVPNEQFARSDDNSYKRIKTQMEYRLTSVQGPTAIIDFTTQVLTPIDSPKVHSQICQQLTSGHVEFDLARGKIVSKKVNWNEKVIAFHGDNSLTHYLGEYTIRSLDSQPQAQTPRVAQPVIAKPLQIRTRFDPPVFRR